MSGYEAFSFHSRFSAKGREQSQGSKQEMWQQTILGSPWDWCHLYSRTVENTPLLPTAESRGNAPSPVFLHTHRPQPPGVSCLPHVITEWTTPNHIPMNRKASPVIRDRVLRESLF